jgi:hypothetical protein
MKLISDGPILLTVVDGVEVVAGCDEDIPNHERLGLDSDVLVEVLLGGVFVIALGLLLLLGNTTNSLVNRKVQALLTLIILDEDGVVIQNK